MPLLKMVCCYAKLYGRSAVPGFRSTIIRCDRRPDLIESMLEPTCNN